ncbi:MAG: ABC transporter ATP-binding protein [Chloroflexota bacterium]|nr:ABC transporter ATP-binding protein [Anaerolineae bacterium]
MTATNSPIITESLTKHFGRGRKKVQAVQEVNLTVEPGQVYGFLGPNGAGKTTTIRMLLRLLHPTAGRAYVYGQNVARHPEVLRRVGAIVEGASFYNFLSARRNLEVLSRTADHYDPARIDALLAQVGLTERKHQRVKGYSTGMKQRLGLAAALLGDPDLLILDEPTNGLDPGGMHEIREFIRRLATEQGKTIFLSSHLLGEVEQICDRVAIIQRGAIVREGAVSDLLESSASLRIEARPIESAASALSARWPVVSNTTWLSVQAARDEIPAIVRTLVQRDIDVYQITSQRQSLEEYFLSVVSEGAPHG